MTEIIKHEGGGLEKKPMTDSEIAEARKKFLVEKYYKKDVEIDLNSLISFGVFRINIDQTGSDVKIELICKCETQEQAISEIRWRAQFHHRPNNDIVMEKDSRFKTFKDETKNVVDGKEVQHGDRNFKGMGHYTSLDLDYTGDYFIYPIYEIRD